MQSYIGVPDSPILEAEEGSLQAVMQHTKLLVCTHTLVHMCAALPCISKVMQGSAMNIQTLKVSLCQCVLL